MNFLIPIVALLLAGWLAISKRLSGSTSWQATVTPLASIMGSGFLISAPLLGGLVGTWAVVGMLCLLVIAYLVGEAIRYNIRHFEPVEQDHGPPQTVAFLSRLVLVGAYFISVVYYLELLAVFALHLVGVENQFEANLITSALLLVIGLIGFVKGLGSLEKVERFAVALNLGMVGALLAGLLFYNAARALNGSWQMPDVNSEINRADLRVLLGLLIVVQGFETSRYLGAKHSAEERIRTMRFAQLLSGAIYILFVALATVLFRRGMGGDVTAILLLTKEVALVLPVLLTVAALGSQFSAAVADTAGAGGLVVEISGDRFTQRTAYVLIMGVTLTLTWLVDVNEVIAMASRAFALFYALQCLVAMLMAFRNKKLPSSSARGFGFGCLSLVCLSVVIFGIPAES
ncbi:MAG: hypothetical protein AAGA96_05065 [Verrucomicrobiota bacterium]